ncbi:MAG: TauD/TfdA family dioxygenase [Novosphingobium sp.]|nr:TauD/TfdA family dioxygenase [Novosphingobium sp.]
MPWNERKLTDRVGVELTGARIGPGLSKADRQAVYNATSTYGAAVLPGQDLSDDDIFDFAASLEDEVVEDKALEGVRQTRVMPLGNVDVDGNILPADDWVLAQNLANELWHVDRTFMIPRATISMLYGKTVPPEGGNTEFCDTRLFWEAMPEQERARLSSMKCSHSLMHSRARYGFDNWTQEALDRFPPVERPMIAEQKRTGRIALILASHICAIEGLSNDDALALVDDLIDRATVPANVYSHQWREGDLVLWDNRCVMHRARPFDMAVHARDVRAIRLYDPANI